MCPEDTVPYVELAKLSDKGLCGIKSASHSVLENGKQILWGRFTSRTGLLTLQESKTERTLDSIGPADSWHLRCGKWLYSNHPFYTGETEAEGKSSCLKPDSQPPSGEEVVEELRKEAMNGTASP